MSGEKKVNMKNAFLNLAVPILQLTEPADAPKVKLNDKLAVTIWDRWEIKKAGSLKLKDIFEQLEGSHKLKISDIFFG